MKPIVLLLSFLLINQLTAQVLPKAVVYTITGNVSVFRNGKNVLLKQKDYIFYDDIISIKKSATITLFTQDGKFIELNQAQRYSYKDLQQSLQIRKIGITEKYLELIWHDLFKPSSEKSGLSTKSIGGATGGARRGDCDINIEPLNKSKLSDDTLFFSWKKVPNATFYKFALADNSNNEYFNIMTTDTVLILLKRGLLKDEANTYYWSVDAGGDKMGNCSVVSNAITITSSAEKQIQINALIKEVPNDSDEFIYKLKISDKLAINGWYKEAFEYAKQASLLYKK